MKIAKRLHIGGINYFFSDLVGHISYLIPVLLFTGASILHLVVEDNINGIFILQGILLSWIIFIAIRHKLVIWPVLLIGVIFILSGTGLNMVSENKMKKATEAYQANDNRKAKEILESIDSDKIKASKEYTVMLKTVDKRLDDEVAVLIKKTKKEINNNKLDEARRTLSVINSYANDNKEIPGLTKAINSRDLIAGEKQLFPDSRLKVQELKRAVNSFIRQNRYPEAKAKLNEFIASNPEPAKESIIITDISDRIQNAENDYIFNKERKQSSARIDMAVKLFHDGDLKGSRELAEQVLKYDSKNVIAKRLVDKTNNAIYRGWKKKILIGVVPALVILILWFLVRFITRCPRCGRFAARIRVSDDVIDSRGSYRWGTETDYISGSGFSMGTGMGSGMGSGMHTFQGTISRNVKVPTTIDTISTIYTCKYCSHNWSVKSTSEEDA